MAYHRSKEKEKELAERKEQIFDVAMKMMQESSYEELTIRDICAKAQISTGMFYKLYPSKLELLGYYYDKLENEFDQFIKEELAGLTVEEKIIQFYIWVCRFTSSLGVDFCSHFFDSKNELMNSDRFHNKIMAITDIFIEEAQADGQLPGFTRQAHAVSKDLCILIKGVIFDWSAREGKYDMAAFAEELVRRCLPALLV